MENTNHDRSAVPRLYIDMKAEPWLSTTLPYYIDITIRREDNDDRSCIFRWSPHVEGFSPSGLILLTINGSGSAEKVEINHSRTSNSNAGNETILVNGWNQFLWELRSGGKIKLKATLPENYHRALVPGRKYELVCPEAEIALWDWGTVQDHLGMELKAQSPASGEQPERARLAISSESKIAFSVREEDMVWPGREAAERRGGFVMANLEEQQWRLQQRHIRAASPPPIEPTERIPGAPILRVELECATTVTRNQILDVQVKVIYEGIAQPDGEEQVVRPISLHTYAFQALSGPREGFRLDRRSRIDDQKWEPCNLDDETGFRIVDEPDIEVRVGQDENFIALEPGRSWISSRALQREGWTSLPADTVVGDVFRYRFKGTTVNWWDWGNLETHLDAVVKLPCWIAGAVTEPADNGGRAKLVVPASKAVEFTFIE